MSPTASLPRPASLARAAGIDIALLAFGIGAVLVSFLVGHDVPKWRNLVFAPVVFALAALTMRMVLAEVRALWTVLPETTHKGEAITALGVAIVMSVIVGPMLLIMPFVFFGSV